MLPVLMLAASLAALTPPPAWQQTWRESFAATDSASVRVRTNDARVHVTTRESGPVEVVVHHSLKLWGWSGRRTQPKVAIRREGGVVVVEADAPRNRIVFGGVTREFSIRVTMPRRGTLLVQSGDGRIECEPFTGDVRLENGDGAILGTGLRGRVALRTGDGRIEASGLDGDVTARTGDGRIRLEGRFDRLDARTGDGSVAVTARAGSRLESGWSVETNDGPVRLAVPRTLSALLDAQTGGGRIVVDLPITVPGRTRRSLTGELNGGRVPLRVRTGDGTIRLGLSTP